MKEPLRTPISTSRSASAYALSISVARAATRLRISSSESSDGGVFIGPTLAEWEAAASIQARIAHGAGRMRWR